MSDTSEAWAERARALSARMQELTGQDFCQWVAAETHDGTATVAVPFYHPVERELWALLEEVSVGSHVADWSGWLRENRERLRDCQGLRSLPIEDLAMYAVHLRRSEQFHDGGVQQAFDGGFLTVLLERLCELAGDLPYDPSRCRWAAEPHPNR